MKLPVRVPDLCKYHVFKDGVKDLLGLIRDLSLVYFIGARIAQ